MELNVMYLYPDLLNLYGDRGNIAAIEMVCTQMGIQFHLNRIDDFDTKLDFENTDMIFLCPGQLSTFPVIINRLEQDASNLQQFIENDGYIVVIGTSACIFADKVQRIKRQSYKGLGIGQYDCTERSMIYGDDLLYTCNVTGAERKVAGNQIQIVNTELKEGAQAFAKIIYGYGNAHNGFEGFRYRNFITTNALGPVFVKNPWVMADMVADIMRKKGYSVDTESLNFTLEQKSYAAVERFNLNKKTDL